MYIVLIGPPGRPRKTTAARHMLELLEETPVEISADSTTKEALIRAMAKSGREFEVRDDHGVLQIKKHSSILIFSEELTVFLGYRNLDLMTYMGEWYDCKKIFRYDTKNMGSDTIMGVCANLLGATTPELLQESIPKELISGGFASRLILVYETDIGKPVSVHQLTDEERELKMHLIADLQRINQLSGEYKMDDQFKIDYDAWYKMQLAAPKFRDSKLQGYEARRPTHIRKLSMIVSAASRGDLVLKSDDLINAIKILDEVEEKLPLVYRGIGAQSMFVVELAIKEYIMKHGAVRLSKLTRDFQSEVTHTELAQILARIKQMGIADIRYEPGVGNTVYVRDANGGFASMETDEGA